MAELNRSCNNCKHNSVADIRQYPCHKVKVITRGNCMMCGKELTEGLFFCKDCEAKAIKAENEVEE